MLDEHAGNLEEQRGARGVGRHVAAESRPDAVRHQLFLIAVLCPEHVVVRLGEGHILGKLRENVGTQHQAARRSGGEAVEHSRISHEAVREGDGAGVLAPRLQGVRRALEPEELEESLCAAAPCLADDDVCGCRIEPEIKALGDKIILVAVLEAESQIVFLGLCVDIEPRGGLPCDLIEHAAPDVGKIVRRAARVRDAVAALDAVCRALRCVFEAELAVADPVVEYAEKREEDV